MTAVGPGVIVLGRVDRRRRVRARSDRLRPSRPDAALGHDGGRVLPDGLQHRADALHARHRRAGVHRLHADAAACRRVGLVLCRPLLPAGGVARLGRRGVGRDLLPVHRTDGRRGRRQCRVSDRRLHVPAVRGAAAARTADRANAGAAQLGHGRLHAGRAARPVAVAGSARDVGGRVCGTGRIRHLAARLRLPAGGRRLLPACGLRRLLRVRRDDEHHAVQLGARQGLRDGAARRLHSGRGRRTEDSAGRDRVHLHA